MKEEVKKKEVKKPKKKVTQIVKEFKYIEIDRPSAYPCKICRKRECCVLRPIDSTCRALDKGEPWISPNEFAEIISLTED